MVKTLCFLKNPILESHQYVVIYSLSILNDILKILAFLIWASLCQMKYVLLNWSHFFLQMAIITFEEFTKNLFKFEIYYFHIFLLFSNLFHPFLKLKLAFIERPKSLIEKMHIDRWSIRVHRWLHGMSGHRVHGFILRHPPPGLRASRHLLDWGSIWVLVVTTYPWGLFLHFYL